jgi:hypothetical protein
VRSLPVVAAAIVPMTETKNAATLVAFFYAALFAAGL